MKTQFKYRIAMAFIFYAIFSSLNLFSQAPWHQGGDAVTNNILGTTNANDVLFVAGASGPNQWMDLTQTGNLGVTNYTTYPAFTAAHLIDVFGGDINVSDLVGARGYLIGGNSVLNVNGDNTCIFVGEQVPLSLFPGNGQLNTCIGYSAGSSLLGSASILSTKNTFSGAFAGISVTTVYCDSYYGVNAGHDDQTGAFNTFIGYQAGFKTNGGIEPLGDFNTMTGYDCGYWNTTGAGNSYYGKGAGYNNNGNYNAMFGNHAGDGDGNNYTSDSNSFFGGWCEFNFLQAMQM